MGLDSVELVIAFEDAFGIAIPDEDARAMATPGHVVDYLERRLGGGSSSSCLEQRAFYLLRRAGMKVLDHPRQAFAPDTLWSDLLHANRHDRNWSLLGKAVAITPWPRLRPLIGTPQRTVGQTARALAARAPAALMREGECWSRLSIERVVRNLVAEELGISSTFAMTDRFVQELGVS